MVSSRHLKTSASEQVRTGYLAQKGDAPSSVRTEVLAALRIFQNGYSARDPNQLDSFMQQLFPANDDILLLGTDAKEWVRGYDSVRQFIRSDWLNWGDFRFAVDDSVICSSGNVAWVASVGHVRNLRSDRPVRFSAVLIRDGQNWHFRQIQFQWDEQDPTLSDLARWETLSKLPLWWMQFLSNKPTRQTN